MDIDSVHQMFLLVYQYFFAVASSVVFVYFGVLLFRRLINV